LLELTPDGQTTFDRGVPAFERVLHRIDAALEGQLHEHEYAVRHIWFRCRPWPRRGSRARRLSPRRRSADLAHGEAPSNKRPAAAMVAWRTRNTAPPRRRLRRESRRQQGRREQDHGK
jgi:hypothetical protein